MHLSYIAFLSLIATAWLCRLDVDATQPRTLVINSPDTVFVNSACVVDQTKAICVIQTGVDRRLGLIARSNVRVVEHIHVVVIQDGYAISVSTCRVGSETGVISRFSPVVLRGDLFLVQYSDQQDTKDFQLQILKISSLGTLERVNAESVPGELRQLRPQIAEELNAAPNRFDVFALEMAVNRVLLKIPEAFRRIIPEVQTAELQLGQPIRFTFRLDADCRMVLDIEKGKCLITNMQEVQNGEAVELVLSTAGREGTQVIK